MEKTETQLGMEAHAVGQPLDSNPYPRNSEERGAWADGWRVAEDRANPRIATKAEVEAATRLTDLGQFRSRHRRTR
jgi:ribosome modulation factor